VSSMEIKITAKSTDPNTIVNQKIETYLCSTGFKKQISNRGEVSFVRGSLWGSLTSIRLCKWYVAVFVAKQSLHEYELNYVINTTGQIMTVSEKEFWKLESENLKRIVEGDEIESTADVESAIKGLVKRAIIYTILYAVLFSLLNIVIVIILKKIGVPEELLPSPGAGAGFGAIFGILLAIKRQGKIYPD